MFSGSCCDSYAQWFVFMLVSLMSCRSLNFFFWTVWSSEALAAGTSASTPNPLGFGIAWRGREGGYDPCRRQTAQKKIKRVAARWAPLHFPPAGTRPPWRGLAIIGSGNRFPARGVQRTLAVLWPPEASARDVPRADSGLPV